MAETCFLCSQAPSGKIIVKNGLRVLNCHDCGLSFLEKFPVNELCFYREGTDYYKAWWEDRLKEENHVRSLKRQTGQWILKKMSPYLTKGAEILEIGCAFGYFLEVCAAAGHKPSGIEVSGAAIEARKLGFPVYNEPIEKLHLAADSFDAVVMIDVLEHLSAPGAVLEKVRYLLKKKGGLLTILTPDVESVPCRIFGPRWIHYVEEHLIYYSRRSLASFLGCFGFKEVFFGRAWKKLSLQYMASYAERYHDLPPFLHRLIKNIPFSRVPFSLPTGLMAVYQLKP